jgi:hypothetical protein
MKKLYLLLTLAAITISGNVVAMEENNIGKKIIKNFKADVAKLLCDRGTNNALDNRNSVDVKYVRKLINKALSDLPNDSTESELRSCTINNYIKNLPSKKLNEFCYDIFSQALVDDAIKGAGNGDLDEVPLDTEKRCGECCSIQ